MGIREINHQLRENLNIFLNKELQLTTQEDKDLLKAMDNITIEKNPQKIETTGKEITKIWENNKTPSICFLFMIKCYQKYLSSVADAIKNNPMIDKSKRESAEKEVSAIETYYDQHLKTEAMKTAIKKLEDKAENYSEERIAESKAPLPSEAKNKKWIPSFMKGKN